MVNKYKHNKSCKNQHQNSAQLQTYKIFFQYGQKGVKAIDNPLPVICLRIFAKGSPRS